MHAASENGRRPQCHGGAPPGADMRQRFRVLASRARRFLWGWLSTRHQTATITKLDVSSSDGGRKLGETDLGSACRKPWWMHDRTNGLPCERAVTQTERSDGPGTNFSVFRDRVATLNSRSASGCGDRNPHSAPEDARPALQRPPPASLRLPSAAIPGWGQFGVLRFTRLFCHSSSWLHPFSAIARDSLSHAPPLRSAEDHRVPHRPSGANSAALRHGAAVSAGRPRLRAFFRFRRPPLGRKRWPPLGRKRSFSARCSGRVPGGTALRHDIAPPARQRPSSARPGQEKVLTQWHHPAHNPARSGASDGRPPVCA